MPRGTQFGELINMFRDEAGHANSRVLGQNQLDSIKAILRRTYRRLHADFNWPFLYIRRDEILQAGERYYSFPAELDQDKIVGRVVIKEAGGDQWYPLKYGIDYVNYNSFDSDANERGDYPYAWDMYEDDQFEVWPVPETTGHIMRFNGKRRPKDLINENDTVDLDDDLVILYAVAEIAARSKMPDADIKLQLARQHYMRLKANSVNSGTVNMKVSKDRGPDYKGIDIKFAERRS